jgi:hypothetical protein
MHSYLCKLSMNIHVYTHTSNTCTQQWEPPRGTPVPSPAAPTPGAAATGTSSHSSGVHAHSGSAQASSAAATAATGGRDKDSGDNSTDLKRAPALAPTNHAGSRDGDDNQNNSNSNSDSVSVSEAPSGAAGTSKGGKDDENGEVAAMDKLTLHGQGGEA